MSVTSCVSDGIVSDFSVTDNSQVACNDLTLIRCVVCVTGSKKLASMPAAGAAVSTTASTAAAPAAGLLLFYLLTDARLVTTFSSTAACSQRSL